METAQGMNYWDMNMFAGVWRKTSKARREAKVMECLARTAEDKA